MPCNGSYTITSNDYLDYITDYPIGEGTAFGGTLDFCSIPVNEQFRVNYVNRSQLPELRVSEYYYYSIPKLYGLVETPGNSLSGFNTLNLTESNIYQVQQSPLQLTGKGVLIGFVDTGIRYTDPVFQDEFGNSRILSIWDQSLEITGKAPEGFFYGSEFSQADINAALEAGRQLVPTWDENGHGSRMAAIAAGSNLGESTFIGAAPDAELVVVKLKQAKQYLRDYYLIRADAEVYQENDIMLACKYLLQFAQVFERPLVIVLGLGTNYGDHAGNSPLGKYLSDINSMRNVAVVVAGGNEGNAGHHYLGNLAQSMEEMPGKGEASVNMEIRVGEGERGFVCELWGSTPDVFEIGITTPSGERIPRISFNYQEGLSFDFVYEETGIDIDIVLVEEFSSQELIFIRFVNPTPGVWTVTVYHQGVLNSGIFHAWLPLPQFMTGRTYFLTPNPYTTITEPGMAQDVFTVGSYSPDSGAFAFFSGRGNNRLGYPKPALAAPGIDIYTPFGTGSGSSISAAFTAGAMADFFEWAVIRGNVPLISGLGIRGYFIQGAAREPEVTYPNREWGYGKLDLNGVFVQLRR